MHTLLTTEYLSLKNLQYELEYPVLICLRLSKQKQNFNSYPTNSVFPSHSFIYLLHVFVSLLRV